MSRPTRLPDMHSNAHMFVPSQFAVQNGQSRMPWNYDILSLRNDSGMPFNQPMITPFMFPTLFHIEPSAQINYQQTMQPQNYSVASVLHNNFRQSSSVPPRYSGLMTAAMLEKDVSFHPPINPSASLQKRANCAIKIVDPKTKEEIALKPRIESLRNSRSISRNRTRNSPILANNVSLYPPKVKFDELKDNHEEHVPNGPSTPSVQPVFRLCDEEQPFTVVSASEEHLENRESQNDFLCGVIDRVRASRSKTLNDNTISVYSAESNAADFQSYYSNVDSSHSVMSNQCEEEISSELLDLLKPFNTGTLAYERKAIVPEETQEWLPSGMQASDDECIDDYLEHDLLTDENVALQSDVMAAETVEIEPTSGSSKMLSRNFLLSCYSNPDTRVKPENMKHSSVVLNKPIDNLLDVLKKVMVQTDTGNARSRYGISRSDMGKSSYIRQHDVKLHHAQDPYCVKKVVDFSETEMKTRQFRSLMNKITESNIARIIGKMEELELNKEELYQPILEIIFDKAIQEPNYCHLYAQVCDFLSKTLRLNFVKEEGETNRLRFKSILIARVQLSFNNKLTDDEAYNKKENELKATNSDVTKKRLRDELDEITRDLKRKYMGNMKFIGQLFKFDLLSQIVVGNCIETLFDQKDSEWQYESLCNLLTVIGSMLDSNNSNLMDGIVKQMKTVLANISDNRIRFMFLDVFDLRANAWQPKKLSDKQRPVNNTQGGKYNRQTYNNRVSGYGGHNTSNQQRYQYSGSSASASRNDSQDKGRKTLSFDKPEYYDNNEYNRNSGTRDSYSMRLKESNRPSIVKKSSMPATFSLVQKSNRNNKQNVPTDKLKVFEELENKKGFYKLDNIESTFLQISDILENDKELWKNVIGIMYNRCLEGGEESCRRFGQIVIFAIKKNLFSNKDFIELTSYMWECASDTIVDVPYFYKFMGASFSEFFKPKNSTFVQLLHSLYTPIAKTSGAGEAIIRMFEIACKNFSNEHVKEAIQAFGFDVSKYCEQGDIHKLLKTEGLEMLVSGEMFMRELYDYLVVSLPNEKINDQTILQNLESEFKREEEWTPKIVQPVMSAILKLSVNLDSNNDKRYVYPDIIERRMNVLSPFFKDDKFEAEAIKVICDYVQSKENPFGLLDQLFTAVCFHNLVSDSSLNSWRRRMKATETLSNSSSGTLVLATKKFFEWLDTKASDDACQSGDEDQCN